MYIWREWARPSQLPPPGDWRVWLLLAGRGFGKTRAGAAYVRARVNAGRTELLQAPDDHVRKRQHRADLLAVLLGVRPERGTPIEVEDRSHAGGPLCAPFAHGTRDR